MKADKARITATAVTAGKAVTAVLEISCVPFRFCGQALFICGVSFCASRKRQPAPHRRSIGNATHHTGSFVAGAVGAGVGLLSGFAVAVGARAGLLSGFAVQQAQGSGCCLVLRRQQAQGACCYPVFAAAAGAGGVLLFGFAVAAGAGVGLPFGLRWQQAQGRAALRFWGSRARGRRCCVLFKIALISTFPSGMVNLSFSIVTPPLTTCHSLK